MGKSMLLSLIFCWLSISAPVRGQLYWTPIYTGGNDRVDLWTEHSRGCECEFDMNRKDCACCIQGGCQCGAEHPSKCAQCGLQQYCNNMCNATLDHNVILELSKSGTGQIKSPSLQGPASCWYNLRPDDGYRLELQIYRLVNAGKFDGNRCQFGYVSLVNDEDARLGFPGVEICGENERFAPPVVLFADKGSATINFRIDEATKRSQFLAYFSFTAKNNSLGVGFRPNGGKRIDNTTCDWLYQDFTCVNDGKGCVLASPGYPGMYAAGLNCKYHVTLSSQRTRLKLTFNSVSLPQNRCATDYVSIYEGSSSNAPLLHTLCSSNSQEYLFAVPNILIEFKSGPSIPPYDYNGFVATMEFSQTAPIAELVTTTPKTSDIPLSKLPRWLEKESRTFPNAIQMKRTQDKEEVPCKAIFYGNVTRSGHFDSRILPWNKNCVLTFVGAENDLILVSLFNYRLQSDGCDSFIKIFDGTAAKNNVLKKICGPAKKNVRNSEGKFEEKHDILSHGNNLTIVLIRSDKLQFKETDFEFVDGAFSFLDQYGEGTQKPGSFCDAQFLGLSSSPVGRIRNYGTQHTFWNVEGALNCSHKFLPADNQSITLKLLSLSRLTSEDCRTECGDSGCQCVHKNNSKEDYDRLIITNQDDIDIWCICGNFGVEWLPITVRSWTPLIVRYFVRNYAWAEKGFAFEIEYSFSYDGTCGRQNIQHASGNIHRSLGLETGGDLNYYYNQYCAWFFHSNVERQLTFEISSDQNRPCTAWNISLHEYAKEKEDHAGSLLHTFCPRQVNRIFNLPWKMNQVTVKLNAVTRKLPEYQIKWKSHFVKMQTIQSDFILPPRASNAEYLSFAITSYFFPLFLLFSL